MILVVPDPHFREQMSYADQVEDRRIPEKQEILDFVVSQAEDCTAVVIIGDCYDVRNPSTQTIKEFTNFIERFSGKELFIIAGNHDQKSGGKTTIDYLAEIKNDKWHIVLNKIERWNECDFVPYFTKANLGVNTHEEATKKLMTKLKGGSMLFVHHSISGTFTSSGIDTNMFNEIVLPKDKLESKYKLVVGGHIHSPSHTGNTIVTGSLFNSTVGETGKFLWKVDEQTMAVTKVELPGRKIYKLENPSVEDLNKLEKNSIVKVIITEKNKGLDDIKDKLEEFDGSIILEQYGHERKRVGLENEVIDFGDVKSLLAVYSKERKVPLDKLESAFELINQ